MRVKLSSNVLFSPNQQQPFTAQPDGSFLCGKERCERKFESEMRAKEHWARMHSKSSTFQKIVSHTVNSNYELLKLPSINGTTMSANFNEGTLQQSKLLVRSSKTQSSNFSMATIKRVAEQDLLIEETSAKRTPPRKLFLTPSQLLLPSLSRPSSSSSSTTASSSFSLREINNKSCITTSFKDNTHLLQSTASNFYEKKLGLNQSFDYSSSPLCSAKVLRRPPLKVKKIEKDQEKETVGSSSNSIQKNQEILLEKQLAKTEGEQKDVVLNVSFDAEEDVGVQDEEAFEKSPVSCLKKEGNRVHLTKQIETIQTLDCLEKLEELELEKKIVSSKFNYMSGDVIYRLKQKKLDGEDKLTDRDRYLSRDSQRDHIRKQTKRPASAGEVPYASRCRQELQERVEGDSEGNSNEESQVDNDLNQIQNANVLEEELKQEMLAAELEGKMLQEERDELVSESSELTQTIAEFHQLKATKDMLSSKYRGYVTTLRQSSENEGGRGGGGGAQCIKMIFKLNLRIADIEAENMKLMKDNEELFLDKEQMLSSEEVQILARRGKEQHLRTTKGNNELQGFSEQVDVDSDDQDVIGGEEEDSCAGDYLNKDREYYQEEEEEVCYNETTLNFDIGFESDDLAEDAKEMKKPLQDKDKDDGNRCSLSQVKRELNYL